MTRKLTRAQARRFLLRKHGLVGEYRFEGAAGAAAYVRQTGCVQFDPIDVCGRNADLVFQSRVKGYTKETLDALLYRDRLLVDYFDKNLAIIPVEDWPYFARTRAAQASGGRSRAEVDAAADAVRKALSGMESVSAKELNMPGKVDWYWSATSLARATLEAMYFAGELVIHHKKGTVKSYAPASRMLPEALLSAPDPFANDEAFHRWQALRRVGAVGMLRNAPSDAWLCVPGFQAQGRNAAFAAWQAEGKILEIDVDGETNYALASDAALLDEIEGGAAYAPRCELLAPLDCFLWDRRVIARLFDFAYTWEIYTPQAKRKYGYYVLPILCGEALVGRVEPVRGKDGALHVKGCWWEGKPKKAELNKCLKRFARFNGCEGVVWD